ncbi:MAG: hypothetical protein ACR652_06580 [Methylocystis sp.]|uniref:hypothetical protein n=1 Tax=Methylocystis sp. TaxID=1911079 RepID=UPI003DA5AC05
MRKSTAALVLAHFLLGFPLTAAAAVSCSPQASGVSGVISDQADVIAAVNCLGQQLAELKNAAIAADRVEAGRIEELARQISALQMAVDSLSRRVSALEANVTDVQRPLATRPW